MTANSKASDVQPAKPNAGGKLKALILVLFIIGAIVLLRYTPVKDYITAESLGVFLESAGFWAPLLYILVYAIGVCLFIPGTLLTGLGAAIFGPYWGFLWVWIGAMIGSAGAHPQKCGKAETIPAGKSIFRNEICIDGDSVPIWGVGSKDICHDAWNVAIVAVGASYARLD